METNTREIKITPPEGFEVDKENSTFECIKFKRIVGWKKDPKKKIKGFYIHSNSGIFEFLGYNTEENYNVFATEKQAKSALAMARISQIMANDARFGGTITDREWNNNINKYTIRRLGNSISPDFNIFHYTFLAFHMEEQRDLFLEENEDLVKEYLML